MIFLCGFAKTPIKDTQYFEALAFFRQNLLTQTYLSLLTKPENLATTEPQQTGRSQPLSARSLPPRLTLCRGLVRASKRLSSTRRAARHGSREDMPRLQQRTPSSCPPSSFLLLDFQLKGPTDTGWSSLPGRANRSLGEHLKPRHAYTKH